MAHNEQAWERHERAVIVDGLRFRVEALCDQYEKRNEVSRASFWQIVKLLLKIGKHIKTDDDDKERLDKALFQAGTGEFVVDLEGDKVFITGRFDIAKLRKEMLW